MFGKPKSVTLVGYRRSWERRILLILGIICVLFYIFFKTFLPVVLLVAFVIIRRLFFAKIHFDPGTNIYVYGEPGSGKTLFLAKLAYDNKDQFSIVVNSELDHLSLADVVLDKDSIGLYDTGKSAYFIDENSFAGFDNRTWSTNFTDESLDYIKKIRHYNSVLVIASQGFGEVDKKLRDSILNRVYHVKNCGRYSKAELLIRNDDSVSYVDGSPLVSYRYPGLLDRLFDPTTTIYIPHKKYGSLVDSFSIRKIPCHPALVFKDQFEKSLIPDRFFPVSDTTGSTNRKEE